jgi:aspartyl aminopeptidase
MSISKGGDPLGPPDRRGSAALDHVADLAAFVITSPSSFHAAAEGARRLAEAGFVEQDEAADWDPAPGGHYLMRDGALVAWRLPADANPRTPYRIVGAHTDSPGFAVKPNPDLGGFGYAQLGVEVYGGPLLNSWLDRELGLAGRVVLADGRTELVRTEAIMRIPQLAVHLDRGVNDNGLKLDKQQHTAPLWGVGRPDRRLVDHIGELVGCRGDQIDGFELFAYDTTAPALFGPDQEFFASGRLDNLTGVHAGLTALLRSTGADRIEVLAAFDHEELGSASRSGASGPLLADVLDRIATARGVGPEQHHQALARSVCLSVDAGHAIHPNYPQRHDPANQPVLNGGPLLKINTNQRYATDAAGMALWRRACRAAGVPTQEFVSNNALPCGSTIGPLTATRLGIRTLDVGQPLLSMHSARELTGTADALALSRAVEAFWAVEG